MRVWASSNPLTTKWRRRPLSVRLSEVAKNLLTSELCAGSTLAERQYLSAPAKPQ